MIVFLLSLLSFFAIELLYFKIADHFNIIDKPNQRSSHSEITLRGGGIIFPIALITGVFLFQISYFFLALGVFAIALISFLDDIITLNNKLRISVHFVSVALIILQVWLNFHSTAYQETSHSYYIYVPIIFIVSIGIINAYNFMDGINGITFLYSLTTLLTCWKVQSSLKIQLFNSQVWVLLIASLLVFGFFNLRKKAKTFAGDVGSISIALVICYLLMQLMLATGELKWILLLGMYGLDSVGTIICRIIRRENIFEAHRSHFYQFLANELKISHVIISFIYALVQLIINLTIIYLTNIFSLCLFILISITYIIFRLKLEGRKRLFISYSK